jgi:hypothetical protein
MLRSFDLEKPTSKDRSLRQLLQVVRHGHLSRFAAAALLVPTASPV